MVNHAPGRRPMSAWWQGEIVYKTTIAIRIQLSLFTAALDGDERIGEAGLRRLRRLCRSRQATKRLTLAANAPPAPKLRV